MITFHTLRLVLLLVLAAPLAAPAHEKPAQHRPSDRADRLVEKGDALMQQSRDRLDPALWVPAEEAYRAALALDPKCATALVGLAWVHNSEHEFADGRRFAEAALAIDPTLPDAFALIGDGCVELGDYDAAFAAYQRALDIKPDQSSYGRAAHLLWLTGSTGGALKLMEMAIDAGGDAPENTAWCRAQLAMMHFNSGDIESAEALVEEALRSTPENAHVLFAAGRIRAARGQIALAIDAMNRSIEIAPSHPALAELVDLYAAAGRDAEARAQFEAVVAFHSTHTHGHSHDAGQAHDGGPVHGSHELALFLADHDRDLDVALAEAAADYARFPNVFAADALAWCQFKAGRTTDAVKTIGEALRWNTPAADLHFHAGMIYESAGDHSRAREHFEKALALNPHFDARFASIASENLARLATKARM